MSFSCVVGPFQCLVLQRHADHLLVHPVMRTQYIGPQNVQEAHLHTRLPTKLSRSSTSEAIDSIFTENAHHAMSSDQRRGFLGCSVEFLLAL